MLIINKYKPFYIDKKNKIIRMGNFKNTGKEILYEDENLIRLFKYLDKPVDREKLINKAYKEFNVSKDELSNVIDYLIDENFIINYDEYKKIVSKSLGRQELFFSMTTNKNIEWIIDKQPKILILGLGGVGSNVALTLSRAGFKSFIFVDHDKVEESNLIRQLPYNYEDIGKYKVDVLKNRINKENNMCIDTLNINILKEKDIEEQIIKSDIVLCTVDKPYRIIRRLINDVCVKNNKPVIFSGFSEHVAMVGPFIIPGITPCLNCIDKKTGDIPLVNVETVPSYGPLCLLISSIVSNEIINYFYKYNKNNLIGKTLMYDILSYKQKIIKWTKNEKCEVCASDNK